MRRRTVLGLLGCVMMWPRVTGAQTAPAKRLGVIIQGGPDYAALTGLREGLRAAGLGEGAHFELSTRNTLGDLTGVETAAKGLEDQGFNVIVVFATSAALAAMRGTARIPIVFTAGADPVAFGLVHSVAKPGGRLTGVHSVLADATAKRFEFLHQLVPALKRVVTFYNPSSSVAVASLETASETARRLGVEILALEVRSPEEVRERVRQLQGHNADAYFFVSDAMVHSQGELIVERTAALRMPVVAYEPDLVAKGALAAYGVNYRELGRVAARYVSLIFAGAEARDLPVERIDRPTLAINLNTARALGLEVSDLLLVRADEVIE
jgi:putative tryptophan/tyrosine transport system substrate-binding protein